MKEKRKLFYISTIGLYLFAVFGQWVCGLAYDNQRCLQQREMRLRMLAVIAVCVLCVRLLRGDGRSKRVWRPILGAALSVCMLAAMVYPLLQACNTRDSFAVHPRLIEREGGAHWTGALDWLEEEKKLWKLSHWAGRGEVWYQLDDAHQDLFVSVSDDTIPCGGTAQLSVVGIGDVHYTSDNEEVVKANMHGKLYAMAPGTAAITITADGDQNHYGAEKTISVAVKEK